MYSDPINSSSYIGQEFSSDSIEDVIGGTVATAVVGGTMSEISGGKFSNGARTVAMGYLFNAMGGKLTKKSVRVTDDKITAVLKSKFGKVAFDSDGNLKPGFEIDGKAVTLTVNPDGTISASGGFFKGEYHLEEGLKELGLKVPGASITLSDFSKDNISWSIDTSIPKKYNLFGWGFEFGVMDWSGSFNPNPVTAACQNGWFGAVLRNRSQNSGGMYHAPVC